MTASSAPALHACLWRLFPQTHSYYASVLIVVHQSKGVKEPVLKFRDVNVPRWEARDCRRGSQQGLGCCWGAVRQSKGIKEPVLK